MMKILFSGFRDPNHSSYGGYDKITGMKLGKIRSLLVENYPFGKKFKTHWIRIGLALMDIHTRLIRSKYDIAHFFYGELTCLPIRYVKKENSKTVITLHLDIAKSHHKWLIGNLSQFDGIIVLSSQQKQYLKEKCGVDSVFIPHGFDKPSFENKIPKDNKNDNIDLSKVNLITIGSNYRDYKVLERVIQVFKYNPRYHFHIVGCPKNIGNRFRCYENVSVYNRLNNDEYYSLLFSCDYNFLPLTFATANNTLLEAQSLGVTSILPKISGILDYGAPEPLNMYYNTEEELITIISSLQKKSINIELMAYSKRFSWDNINNQIYNFYQSLYEA